MDYYKILSLVGSCWLSILCMCMCVCVCVHAHACCGVYMRFPSCTGGIIGNESVYSAGDAGLILGLGRSPGGRHGNPLQYFCLENPMDGGAWWAIAHGVAELDTATD